MQIIMKNDNSLTLSYNLMLNTFEIVFRSVDVEYLYEM